MSLFLLKTELRKLKGSWKHYKGHTNFRKYYFIFYFLWPFITPYSFNFQSWYLPSLIRKILKAPKITTIVNKNSVYSVTTLGIDISVKMTVSLEGYLIWTTVKCLRFCLDSLIWGPLCNTNSCLLTRLITYFLYSIPWKKTCRSLFLPLRAN